MKGKPQSNPPTGIKYYAVIYLYNDSIHSYPFPTQEEAEKEVERLVKELQKKKPKDPKHGDYVKNYYVVKRNMDKYPNGEVF